MAKRFTEEVNGEGVAWGAGGFAASLLVGILIEPFRRTVGLENVVLVYLLVVVLTAAVGGPAAGLISALSAALSYDFFLTTPYHSLTIDSLAQVITVGLLFATGIVASLAGRARRRSALAAKEQADAIRLLEVVTRAAASGADADRVAAEAIRELLDARRVMVQRSSPGGEFVAAAVGAGDEPLDLDALPHLDAEGRIPIGHHRVVHGGMVLPNRGVVFDLVHRQHPVGALVVLPRQDQPAARSTRLALAAVANTLAAVGPTGPRRPAAL